jgi:hypothetical protein
LFYNPAAPLIEYFRWLAAGVPGPVARRRILIRKGVCVVLFKLLRVASCVLMLIGLAAVSRAQGSPAREPGANQGAASDIQDIVQSSQQYLKRAEECFAAGNLECARREFDQATDIVVNSGIDVRSDTSLKVYWRLLLERINGFQSTALNGSSPVAWKTQEYEGQPPTDAPDQPGIASLMRDTAPLTVQSFQIKFAELQARFREKFGRDMVITGADHEEHRRLYGSGSAYDVRVKDLSSEEVKFIIDTGRAFGLRVKDFSTWDKVQAHNARVLGLGLQSDTLATSVHLHIDRNPEAARTRYVADPAFARQH